MRRSAAALVLLLAAAGGCGGDGGDEDPRSAAEPEPSPSVRTLTPVPLPPEPPPSGELLATIEQSSRDGAANRFQIWVDNDTDTLITPTAVTYTDPRFRTPLRATRLRDVPSQSRRGFQVTQPDRPACGGGGRGGGPDGGTVTVDYTVAGEPRTATVAVSDEADVVERLTAARCLELGIAEVAELSLSDEVTSDGQAGSVGTMTLVVEPTGRPGPTLVIDSIAGNPVLSPGEHGVHEPALTITGDQPPQRVPVPIRPTRCDAHAFAESGSAAAFEVNVHLDGRPGQVILRLGTEGARNALTYAKASCGFLTSIGGGQG